MLAPAAEDPAAEPGLGDVGGLVAVLLASLEDKKGTTVVTVEGVIRSSKQGEHLKSLSYDEDQGFSLRKNTSHFCKRIRSNRVVAITRERNWA